MATMPQWRKEGWRPLGPGYCSCPHCGQRCSTNALGRAAHQRSCLGWNGSAHYLLQRRETDGLAQTAYGSKVRYTSWKTVSKHTSIDDAWETRRPGLYDWRVLYHGKVVRRTA